MEKSIDIDGLLINYADEGNSEGYPVILLHGWGCDHTTVRSICADLSDGMRIISPDLPGHGKSDEPKEVWGTQDFSAFIEKFINKLELKSPHLMGHSFGGRISINYASQHPEIQKIVLIDSAGITPRRSLKYYYKVYSYKAIKRLSLALFGEKKGEKIIEKSLKKRGSADYQAASPRMRAIMSKCVNEDLRKKMPDIKASSLLVWGENDTATPLSDAKIMEKNISDSGLVVFQNAGHYSFLDNPSRFKAVVRSFFKDELEQSLKLKNIEQNS